MQQQLFVKPSVGQPCFLTEALEPAMPTTSARWFAHQHAEFWAVRLWCSELVPIQQTSMGCTSRSHGQMMLSR